MTSRKITLHSCDFCTSMAKPYSSYTVTKQIENPSAFHWFKIINKNDGLLREACKDCGHNIHYLLNKLNVNHKFACTEYTDKNEMGRITIK